jgi:hypothetical protein
MLCLCVSILAACEYFPESTFELSPDSRLPKWFTVPPGMSRRDLTVTMSYYSNLNAPDATFELYDLHKRRLAKVSGTVRNSTPPPRYPSYAVITVNGIVDVVEHRRMEPVFYVTDKPDVWRQLGVPAN